MSATFALQHYAVLEKQTQQIRVDRATLLKNMSAINGIQVWPSQANFILFRVKDAPTVFNGLKENGVLIKNLHGSHLLLENCLRVTVGTPEENQAFLKALKEIV
ncbi:histidinol-phosphate aminotransferase [Beggiatoa sp. PS]|nr:histidinol-phosphate aminotransferase [Beggiatoa sp. PS]